MMISDRFRTSPLPAVEAAGIAGADAGSPIEAAEESNSASTEPNQTAPDDVSASGPRAQMVDPLVPRATELSAQDFDELAQTSETRKIFVLRPGGVVSISSLVAVALALVIEATMVVGLYALWHYRPKLLPWQGVSASVAADDRATAIGGIQGPTGFVHPQTVRSVAKAPSRMPKPPGLPNAALASRAHAAQQKLNQSLAAATAPPLLPTPLWTPAFAPPKLPAAKPHRVYLKPAPTPGVYAKGDKIHIIQGGASGATSSSDDSQPLYHPPSIVKQGVHILGGGHVHGWARGRGASAANTPSPVMKDWHMPMLSLKYQIDMPKPPVVRLVIGKDGHVISATILRSSGHKSVDVASRLAMLLDTFIPRYRDGLPVRSVVIMQAWDPKLSDH